MKTIITQDRQTLFDIAIQHCGDREAAFQIADINDISLTAELPAGLSVTVPDVINQKVFDYYRINNIIPATAASRETIDTEDNIITNDGTCIMVTNNDNNNKIIINND